jgi:FkbM family methyltransferase
MFRPLSGLGKKLLLTESEWNPKVIVGRAIVAILPEATVHRVKKSYYARLLKNAPDDWQETDTSVVRQLVHAGDSVIDIGASIGGYTKFLSRLVGASGHVHSFEPNPPIYDFLSYNVQKLKLTNVTLYDVALSDKPGFADIVIPQYRWGSECHYDATLETNRAAPDCRQVHVRVSTLDSLFVDHREQINFVKCDVNYHELPCIRGALQTIRESKPAILIEVLPDPDKPGSRAAQLFELLHQIGYAACCFDGSRLHERQLGERNQNYFFLTPAHLSALPREFLDGALRQPSPGFGPCAKPAQS